MNGPGPLRKIEADCPDTTRVHVFMDNARYNHAKILRPWLERLERRLNLHYLPPYFPSPQPDREAMGRRAPPCGA